jgi:peptidoglycan/LPS O-acetylase OafA/YrhL
MTTGLLRTDADRPAVDIPLVSRSQPRLEYQPFGTFRLFLAVMVVVSHSALLGGKPIYQVVEPWGFGNTAVMVFFVLSGYIIAEALGSFYAGRVGSFLLNRSLRIIPPYLTALLVSALVHYWLYSAGTLAFVDYDAVPAGTFSGQNLLHNLVAIVWVYPLTYFESVPPYLFVRYLWAVRVEVHFYIAAAVIYAWQRRNVLPLAFLFFAGWWIVAFMTGKGNIYYFMFAPHFLLGVSLRYLYRGYPAARFAVAISFILALIHYASYVGRNAQALVAAPTVLYALFVLGVFVLAKLRVGATARRVDRWLGDLSYPVYLNHYVVTIAVISLVRARNVWVFLMCIPLSLAASWLVAQLTEPLTRGLRTRIRGVALG